ncbi:MAG: aminodeoxychorismate lyase [Arenimonas sp.]|nr:aminodeoxychorismate lyase [Arenimonas sp.]MBP6627245.1 aminodeoxychorismate lyase [Arenimonas sp.]
MSLLATHLYRGSRRVDALDPADRGLAYGDGVFETVLVHAQRAVWWPQHRARLAQGAARLGIPGPEPAWLDQAVADLLTRAPHRAVLKLVYTRGPAGRGYASPALPEPSLVLALHPAPAPQVAPLALRWCETRLAIQPALAGIKHLNRLEQVLARAEWRDDSAQEGLMLDGEGKVACAISANVFARFGGRWLTPSLARCGVAGIARAWVLAQDAGAGLAEMTREQLQSADALFLCNAVRGILPVASLGGRHWPADPAVAALQARLALAEPAFDTGS